VAGRTTALTYTIWMPRTDKAREVKLDSPTQREVVVTTPKIPGLELHLQPGTTIKDEAGQTVTEVSITPIPVDRPPFPLPLGVEVPVYFTIQPGGAYLSKPAQLVYPNYTNLPAGQRVSFWHYDPKRRGWYVYGRGTVTPNGEQVVPDANTRIYAFTGAMISGGPNPPDKGPKDKEKDGDPVDLGTACSCTRRRTSPNRGLLRSSSRARTARATRTRTRSGSGRRCRTTCGSGR
jgi:hypothetical protein